MKMFTSLIDTCFQLLSIEMTIWGFTFSMLQVFIFSCIAGIVGKAIWNLFT